MSQSGFCTRHLSLFWFFLFSLTVLLHACAKTPGVPENRLVVAVPQWFHPSPERPWLERTWMRIQRANPDVVFDLQLIPGKTEQVLQKLLVVQASPEGPNLALVKMHWVRSLVERGLLVPLDEYVPHGTWEDGLPSLRSSGVVNGKRYLLPYDVGVRVILYREDLFQEAGVPGPAKDWTWENLLTAAKALTRDRDGDGVVDQWGFGVPGARSEKTVFQWIPWFWSLGGTLGGPEGEAPSLRSPAAEQAMQWYLDLARKHKVTPATFYSMDQEAIFQGLAGGLFAMTEGGSWEPALLKRYSQYGDRIRMALLPSPGRGSPSATLMDGWGFVLPREDPMKNQVIRQVLTVFSSPEHQWEKYRASRLLSPFQPLYKDPRFLFDSEAEVLAESVHRARPLPDFVRFPVLTEAIEMAMQEVLMDGAAPGKALARQEERLAAQGMK